MCCKSQQIHQTQAQQPVLGLCSRSLESQLWHTWIQRIQGGESPCIEDQETPAGPSPSTLHCLCLAGPERCDVTRWIDDRNGLRLPEHGFCSGSGGDASLDGVRAEEFRRSSRDPCTLCAERAGGQADLTSAEVVWGWRSWRA